MGVQRAKPIDLSAGNEPFHINGGRGARTRARCLCLCVGELYRLQDFTSHAAPRFPSRCTDDSYLMINVRHISDG